MNYDELKDEEKKIKNELFDIYVNYSMHSVKEREDLYEDFALKRDAARKKLKNVIYQLYKLNEKTDLEDNKKRK